MAEGLKNATEAVDRGPRSPIQQDPLAGTTPPATCGRDALTTAGEDAGATAGTPAQHDPLWARLLMPSASDLLFAALLWMMTFGAWGPALLNDADTGWHIRNGEHILRTFSVPRVDYFSYTMAGHAWYAWEWLYDALLGGIHTIAGLGGVVAFTGLIIAVTFALLFRFTLEESGNIVIATALTLVAGAASTIHFLARPHVVTWLMTLIWLRTLRVYQAAHPSRSKTGSDEGGAPKRKQIYWLAALMLPWVNLHGGFLMGLVLLGIFLAANLWTWATTSSPEQRNQAQGRARHLAVVSGLSAIATLLTPYGFKLYIHLHSYLGSRFLMDNISEFLSPNFHHTPVKFFTALLVLSMIALALAGRKLRAIDLLVMVFGAWSGLYAARNIPLASIMLALTIAPLLAGAVRDAAERTDLAARLRERAASLDRFGSRMAALDGRFKAHFVSVVLIVAVIAALGSHRIHPQFNAKHVPVEAIQYLAGRGVHDHFFTPDRWGGYAIYRLYPKVAVFVDDRHDFYGEDFLREYMKLAHAEPGWRDVLDRYQVNYVLVPPDSPLATVLKLTPEWQTAHEDGTALVFERKK